MTGLTKGLLGCATAAGFPTVWLGLTDFGMNCKIILLTM